MRLALLHISVNKLKDEKTQKTKRSIEMMVIVMANNLSKRNTNFKSKSYHYNKIIKIITMKTTPKLKSERIKFSKEK